jgi:hypothetical protein
MEAMVLENSFDCYEMNLLRLLENKVQERRKLMLKHYSEPLTDLVISLLNLDENKRPSFTEILNIPIMKQYSNKISLSNSQTLQSSRAPSANGVKSAYQTWYFNSFLWKLKSKYQRRSRRSRVVNVVSLVGDEEAYLLRHSIVKFDSSSDMARIEDLFFSLSFEDDCYGSAIVIGKVDLPNFDLSGDWRLLASSSICSLLTCCVKG